MGSVLPSTCTPTVPASVWTPYWTRPAEWRRDSLQRRSLACVGSRGSRRPGSVSPPIPSRCTTYTVWWRPRPAAYGVSTWRPRKRQYTNPCRYITPSQNTDSFLGSPPPQDSAAGRSGTCRGHPALPRLPQRAGDPALRPYLPVATFVLASRAYPVAHAPGHYMRVLEATRGIRMRRHRSVWSGCLCPQRGLAGRR